MEPPRTPPISDLALLGDLRSAALVSGDGSVVWCCFPRFDSPACFASLVGTPDNGHWLLAPLHEYRRQRRYLPGSLVLETDYETADGTVRVLDAMLPQRDDHRLVRLVQGVRGTVTMRMELIIRFDYGWIVPWVRSVDGALCATAGPDAMVLRTRVPTTGRGLTTIAELDVHAGDVVTFDLAWHPSEQTPPGPIDVADAVAGAERWWTDWSSSLRYDGPRREAVHQSLRVLKALTFAPTGAIVAAPTTSLPERLGGTRNWDYRYCWLRDSTMTILALMEAGCTAEAEAWRHWLIRAIAGDPSRIQVVYGLSGERRLPELELDWLDGYAGSRPVRCGNGAAAQRQLDVVSEVIDALFHAREAGVTSDDSSWDIQLALLDWLAEHWRLPDQSIWEVRSGAAHFTFSKVMAWVAFDRAVRAVHDHGLPGDADRWAALRDEIHDEVCRRAVDANGRFVQSYEHHVLDASTLMIPLVGFLPADDRRVAATIDAVARELTVDGLVQRYAAEQVHDGVGGSEGTFLLCSFWLVDCLALLGRHREARDLFERLVDLRNDVGLLAEQYDPVGRMMLGNFPQAFSHLALVSSAMMLAPRHTGPNRSRGGGSRGRTAGPVEASSPGGGIGR